MIEQNTVGLKDAYVIKVNSDIIGYIGQLSSKFNNLLNLDIGKTYGFQFDLNHLMKLADVESKYKPVIVYPSMTRDLNFLLNESVLVGDLIRTINKKWQRYSYEIRAS